MSQQVFLSILAFVLSISWGGAQKQKNATESSLDKLDVSALKFRSIGPALTSGRISDFAVHPDKPSTYYVATASGGVWKTTNAGTTYQPIFDGQGSYSIGCVALDPSHPDILWVGTGENNNQRSVAYGDGVYKSMDGGQSWSHMGLKNSEHIGKIIIHPDNSNVIYVAAIGPLWSKGGDRGLYKSIDGGASWKAVLTVDEYTGVNDVVMDPRNPNVLYASTFQRGRHVYTYLGGGPGSGLYKSTDGGEHWGKCQKGLPDTELGRIGLCISPANPEVIYAIVEAQNDKGGFFRSMDQGASWVKRSSEVTSGNYYQEIVASPHDPNTIYTMDTWMKISKDGGKTFQKVGENAKHVDNHCMWIDPMDPEHWLLGCDGGIYETWDAAQAWQFKGNLPVTQFYKVTVDNDIPFYHIYGGTQDNFSLGGPSRTITANGIVNSDWWITHGGDGFESAVDPEDPNIVYAQSQYGVLVRYDRSSGEEVGIQPKERKGESQYRWNWDAPLAVSHHKAGRVYFAANKLFRSDDRGNSWKVISDDLTRQLDRNQLKIMDRVWSIDAINKNLSTSPYGTIVAFSESPLDQDKLAVGTDDGLIQISEDGGQHWRKVEKFAGVPELTYVNAVYFSQHDENTLYAAFNHHKYGDFKPYLFKSTDLGRSWMNISSNLPERGSVYAFEEDHIDKNLIFCGTEFGVFFSPNQGQRWKQLKAGVPTIAVRDLAIQRRENDLVLGTFGRGFYVLDDYSPLRHLSGDPSLKNEIYPIRTAWMYEKSTPLGLPGKAFQGDAFYTGENLDPVVRMYYSIQDEVKSLKEKRQKREKEETKKGNDNIYPTYAQYRDEVNEVKSQIVFQISDANGAVVRTLVQPYKQGLHVLDWDMRFPSKNPINLHSPKFYNPFADHPSGTLVPPGRYTVVMSGYLNGQSSGVLGQQTFDIKALNNTVLPALNREEKVVFQQQVSELSRRISGAQHLVKELKNRMKYIHEAGQQVQRPYDSFYEDILNLDRRLDSVVTALSGDKVKEKLDMAQTPTPAGRIGWIMYEQKNSTSTPTQTHRDSYAIAKEEFEPIAKELKDLSENVLPALEEKLEAAGAPYTPGRGLKMMMGR